MQQPAALRVIFALSGLRPSIDVVNASFITNLLLTAVKRKYH